MTQSAADESHACADEARRTVLLRAVLTQALSVPVPVAGCEPSVGGAVRRAAAPDGGLLANRYRLIGLLGRGGFGSVWRARDEVLHRDVAVKELLVDGVRGGWSTREHVLREARAAARVSAPGAVAVHDVFEDAGHPYIVMELLSGRTLAQTVAERSPLPAADVIRIGLRLLDTLEMAHAAGVLHRDLKPANVMLTDDRERVVLMDFGIAKLVDETAQATLGPIGTPDFMAPELGRVWRATPASDLYSLGVTLRWAFEGGHRPQRCHVAAVATGYGQDDEYLRAAANPLNPVLDALLQDDPHARPTAEELRHLLGAALQSLEGRATRPSPTLPVLVPVRPAHAGVGPATAVRTGTRSSARERRSTSWTDRGRRAASLGTLAIVVTIGAWTTRAVGTSPVSGTGTFGVHTEADDRRQASSDVGEGAERNLALGPPSRTDATPAPSARTTPANVSSATPSKPARSPSLMTTADSPPAVTRTYPPRPQVPVVAASPSPVPVVAELCYIGPDMPALRDVLGYSQSWTYEWVRPGTCHFDTVGRTDDDSLVGGQVQFAHFAQPESETDLDRLDKESYNSRLWEYLNP